MAGVLSMLRDVYLSPKSCCQTQTLLDAKRLRLSLDEKQHLCESLMFCPTLSRMYGCVWRCVGGLTVFLYVFDCFSGVQFSIHMAAWMLCPYVWDIPLYVCLIKRLFGIFLLSNIFAFTSLHILSSQLQPVLSEFSLPVFLVKYILTLHQLMYLL